MGRHSICINTLVTKDVETKDFFHETCPMRIQRVIKKPVPPRGGFVCCNTFIQNVSHYTEKAHQSNSL